jgi:endonuclease/exonuclease/phosphatase family metal-dependent hydrolase
MSKRRHLPTQRLSLLIVLLAIVCASRGHAAGSDIVLYASDARNVNGQWWIASDSSAAGGQTAASTDLGWSSTDTALASPSNYFEFTFSAPANTPYHVWLRMKAWNDSKWNDSVYVQFSDSVDSNGSAIDRIGTTAALAVNLQTCNGCKLSGWGWMDGAYWLSQLTTVSFSTGGTHTLRIQTREDGVMIDQVVLSPSTYLWSAPGQQLNDSTILPRSSSSSVPPSSSPSGPTPYSGTPAALPGTVNGENFDNGGEGIAYHDTTSGNTGGAYRQTDVDIEWSSEGGYDIGWAAAGEWLIYTVNVASSGSYTAQLRVASPWGATMHILFNGASTAVAVPATGGWQSWTTVSVPVTLTSGNQWMGVLFDTGGANFRYVNVSANSSPGQGAGPYSGTPVSLPGHIEAENFDNGGEGVSYHDTTPGNAGGQYRATDVDVEYSAEGGYDIGWTAAGEWLNYTVSVANAGWYTAQLRVASPSGATMHIGFNGSSNLWFAVDIPATGGWQSWTTVNVPVPLGAGVQQMTLFFDTGGVNVGYVDVTSGGSGGSPPPTPPPPPSGSGTDLIVAEWNIEVDDSSSSHARTAIDQLAALSPTPQVIVLLEARATQYSTYINELQNRTGYSWSGAFLSECPLGSWNGGWCSGSEDEGTAVLTMLPINDSSSTYLPYADAYHSARALVRLAVNVNGTNVNVLGTHLQVNDASARYNSMAYLKWWSSNYSGTKLVAGDFNADPDQIDTSSGMSGPFIDSWTQVNSGKALTATTPNPTMQLDYWFVDSNGKARTKWEWVVTPTGTISDHYPLHAAITIQQ